MMSYINETDFVVENKKLVYPEIVTDGLQLYYDAKGKRDTDYHRDIMLDMSGNKNHGKLHNFAYEKHSGYKDGLVFDYIDDKLVRPTLNLQPDDFTFMLNGNIISFSTDGTVKRVQDGEVVESKGFNLVQNGNFSDGLSEWMNYSNGLSYTDNNTHISFTSVSTGGRIMQRVEQTTSANLYYVGAYIKSDYPVGVGDGSTIKSTHPGDGQYHIISVNDTLATNYYSVISNEIGNTFDIQWVIVFNLTETFGAGNEPTKEQMDKIINRFGFIPNAQDLIDHIEYKGNVLGDMENIIDGLYKTEVLSGTEIFTDKADADAVVHVEIDGKSYHAGSGKNIACRLYSAISNGGSITTTRMTSSPTNKSIIERVKPNITYTVSKDRAGTILRYFFYDEFPELDSDVVSIGGNYADNFISTTFTTTSDTKYVAISLGTEKEFSWVQLEEGSTATAYEPPVPTPDYPIEIHSLNDFDVVSQKSEGGMIDGIQVGGRNLLINSSFNSEVREAFFGRNTLINKDSNRLEYITIASLNAGYLFLTPENLKNGKEYTLSFTIESEESAVLNYLYFRRRVGSTGYGIPGFKLPNQRIAIGSNEVEVTFKVPEAYIDINGLWFGSSNSVEKTFVLSNLKLEKGNKATDWTPAPEDITESDNHSLIDKTNILLSEPLRSIGDVKDRLFRDSDGLWKVERIIGEAIIGGNRIWAMKQEHFYIDFSSLYGGAKTFNYQTTHLKFDKLIVDDGVSEGFRFGGMSGATHNGNLIVYAPRFKSGAELQSFFGASPMTVLFELETPNIETLPQADQDKLNNIASYKGSNYLYTIVDKTNILSSYVRDNLKPNLNAKFLYNNWYKEDRVINNLMIYNRALTNEEMLQNYKTIKRRWGM